MPNQYQSVVRVYAPAPCEDWWRLYRDLFHAVASVGERHTSTPKRAWLAIWEGHGFDTASTHRAWREPPAGDAERRERDAQRARLREEDRRRNAAIRAAMDPILRFDLPHRAYYLVQGAVTAVTGLRYPGFDDGWRNPDLFWPDDRQWFVATDVDFWSLYIGGDDDFVTELGSNVPTHSEFVTFDDHLEIEV